MAKRDGGVEGRVALELVAVQPCPVTDDVRDVAGVDVRKALPCREDAGRRAVAAVAEAQLPGDFVGDAEGGVYAIM